MERDFLDEIAAATAARDPDLAEKLLRARQLRSRLRGLVAQRRSRGLSVEQVAARMGASVEEVADLEIGDFDAELLARYARAIGASPG